jgi:hypothetical protein
MSSTGPSRPATKSVGAAVVGLVLTLVILVVAMLSFLIAPLVALGVAYVVYAVMRPRSNKRPRPDQAVHPDTPGLTEPTGRASHNAFGFGAGTAP